MICLAIILAQYQRYSLLRDIIWRTVKIVHCEGASWPLSCWWQDTWWNNTHSMGERKSMTVWDVTFVNTFAQSHIDDTFWWYISHEEMKYIIYIIHFKWEIHFSFLMIHCIDDTFLMGAAANHAATLKTSKYTNLTYTNILFSLPLKMEACGPNKPSNSSKNFGKWISFVTKRDKRDKLHIITVIYGHPMEKCGLLL